MKPAVSFAAILTRFFTQRLMQQRHASPHTVSSYRDTFRLLLRFSTDRTGKSPSSLAWQDIDAPLITEYLDHLENHRGVSARSRNLRLTAIRSLFKYAAFELPEHAVQIQQVLAIPCKRCVHRQIGYLERKEVDALLAAPDQGAWSGRRDHAWLLLAVQSGLRLSELTGLTRNDVDLGSGAHVRVIGKGRKERCTPLTKQTAAVLRAWLAEPVRGTSNVLFPNREGGRMSNDGIQYLLAKHANKARQNCPSLGTKRIFPHLLRHTAAMNLLQAGVDTSVIAMWLGHESVETTHVYLNADLELKRQVLTTTASPTSVASAYRPDDALLTFLKNL
ncbi:site-specific integrase [Azohydromonas aeria]|uniref:site-specific integrase n=1 Tax=Azohydromonas aeria TaxID=2590212 RepID=UPI0012FB19CB|nr:site-specific integrase [Azohydromonas aeria]